MNTENKIFIKSFLISGLAFAIFMAGFDYFTGKESDILKFLFRFSVFGLFLGLGARYRHKKQIDGTDK